MLPGITDEGIIGGPAAIGLIVTGHSTRGVLLLAFGVLVVGMLDNVLRPFLTRRGLHVHPLLVFLGLFGGIMAFGPTGVFLGPLFVSLFVALAHIYEREMAHGAAAFADARVPEITLGAKLKEVIDGTILKREPFGLLFAAGCASIPAPTKRIVSARAAIRSASEVGATAEPTSGLHLKLAIDAFDEADRLGREDDNEGATYALMRAESDAELAIVLTRATRADDVARQSEEQLRAQSQRTQSSP